MNREPKNIELLWHSATLAEKTISSTVSSIDHKLSQILTLHQHIEQAPRFPPHETDSYQNRPFVEENQTYKQPQYSQFNSRKNCQAESRNTYLPPPQNNYRQNRDRRQEGTPIEPSIACFVTMKGIREIYVQLKTKHAKIAIKIGHFSRACLDVKRPQQRYGLATGFVRGEHKVKSQQILTVSPQCHNMVKIHIGEQQTRALCDSEAEITCISEHFFKSTNVHASALQRPSL